MGQRTAAASHPWRHSLLGRVRRSAGKSGRRFVAGQLRTALMAMIAPCASESLRHSTSNGSRSRARAFSAACRRSRCHQVIARAHGVCTCSRVGPGHDLSDYCTDVLPVRVILDIRQLSTFHSGHAPVRLRRAGGGAALERLALVFLLEHAVDCMKGPSLARSGPRSATRCAKPAPQSCAGGP